MAAAPISPGRGRFTLLVRDGCHLCVAMRSALAPLAAAAGYDIDEVDVDTDAALEARWGDDVPVLLAGEHELCRHRLDRAALTAYLAAAR